MSKTPLSVAVGFLLCIAAGPAFGHSAAGLAGGLASGFLHPLAGPDHIIAMVAVGLWGAFLGSPALWLLPIVFPMVMTIGGAIGIVLGEPSIVAEKGIAMSGVILGLAVALAARPPIWVAAVVVGAFAIFHGYSHGVELPLAADPPAYAIGFVVATGLLHLCGIAFGLTARWPAGILAVRAAGAAIAAGGLAYLTGFA